MSVYTVYISSTYRDLNSYRQTVRDSLHKVPNFRVVGMEDYVAEGIKPLARCLFDVAACDIYMLILANRYGYVIGEENLSVTQLEYRQAKALNKVILVFKADPADNRFPADTDEPGQPSAVEKQARLAAFRALVSSDQLSHPEGFTSEYHLALQVMESLVRNPKVDFDGELPEDRKIFCNRANQVYDFYELVRKKQPFNVFLIQGTELDLGQSLVERLSKYYLSVPIPTSISYHEFITDASYPNFRRRLLNELSYKLLPNDPSPPADPVGLLTALKVSGVRTAVLVSPVSDAVQWQRGYQFLNDILLEFSQASQAVAELQVYWFIVIDIPNALQQQLLSVDVLVAPTLTLLKKEDIKSWISNYINNDVGTVLDILNLCFGIMLQPPFEFDMYQTQNVIRKFIKRYNLRRKNNDQELLDILP